MVLVFLSLALASAAALPAGDLQSWSTVEYVTDVTDRVKWQVEGVARIRDGLSSVYDRRVGTGVQLGLSKRFDVPLAYLLRNRERMGFGFGWDHRLIAGLTYSLIDATVAVQGATLYERHIGRPDVSNFNRYRQQFEVEQQFKRISPWLYQSLAFRNEGFVRSRSRLGIRWKFGSSYSFKVAYQFESVRERKAWGPRHAIVTEWTFLPSSTRGGLGGARAGEERCLAN